MARPSASRISSCLVNTEAVIPRSGAVQPQQVREQLISVPLVHPGMNPDMTDLAQIRHTTSSTGLISTQLGGLWHMKLSFCLLTSKRQTTI